MVGVVCTENDQINIALQQSAVLSATTKIVPKNMLTGKLDLIECDFLVRTTGKITKTEDQGKYGYKRFIVDEAGEFQIYISRSIDLIETIRQLNIGDVISVSGFAGVYHDTDEILLRQKGYIITMEIH